MTHSSNAHEVALEWLKQLITLSSGIVAFSGTFVPLVSEILKWPLVLLGVSWLLFIVVIVLCLEVVSAITYSRLHNDDNWAQGKFKTMALIAKWCFIGGMILFVAFSGTGVYSIVNNPTTPTPTPQATNQVATLQSSPPPSTTATPITIMATKQSP